MSDSAAIASQLPYLRRFARALTGSQRSGDAYAIAALEAIAGSDEAPRSNGNPKRYLFHVFLKIWTSMAINHCADEEPLNPKTEGADRTLEAITPMPRVAFLLHALEGFSTQEIAEILEIPLSNVEMLLHKAGVEIASQLSTGVLIIEDEPVVALDLEGLVSDLGHKVTRIARTHKEAIAAVKHQKPGLVLADIQLADDSSGLDAVNEILSLHNVPVIFITAFPERLLTGARPEPTFLITKPFRPQTVMAVISQALFFQPRAMSPAS